MAYNYKKKGDDFSLFRTEYDEFYTEDMDKEGLSVLKWSMFDSPDKLGSGKMFMESEPVLILDAVFRTERLSGFIYLGYTSKSYADRIGLASNSSHRVGQGVKFKCLNAGKRLKLTRGLIQYGIERIHLYNDSIYFDTDSYLKEKELRFFNV
jgi:hypothetical protein|tara:strand:- start:106 stop:561 length:456 start_codon:yes stop_codon:yes gene_type:complete